MFYNQITHPTGTGSSPYLVAVDDVNSDDKPDIVVANSGTGYVGVLLNAGNGIFLNQTTYSTGGATSSPRSVVLVDVNSDSQPDIVVVNNGLTNVGVLLNAGNGTFLNQTTYPTGSAPRGAAVGDMNGDNKPDIVVANSGANTVSVFLNAGNGTFLSQATYTAGAGSGLRTVTVGDVNGDNKLDIVVPNSGSTTVGVLLNAGNGTFLNPTTYSTGAGSTPYTVVVVDVNSDNKPDLVVANFGTSTIGVLLNAGNGTFLNQTTYLTGGTTPRSVTVGDVNSDGQPDIVVPNSGSTTVGVFLNAGNGTFLGQTTYPTGAGSSPYSVVAIDVNNDNKTDIVVADNGSGNVGVLLHC